MGSCPVNEYSDLRCLPIVQRARPPGCLSCSPEPWRSRGCRGRHIRSQRGRAWQWVFPAPDLNHHRCLAPEPSRALLVVRPSSVSVRVSPCPSWIWWNEYAVTVELAGANTDESGDRQIARGSPSPRHCRRDAPVLDHLRQGGHGRRGVSHGRRVHHPGAARNVHHGQTIPGRAVGIGGSAALRRPDGGGSRELGGEGLGRLYATRLLPGFSSAQRDILIFNWRLVLLCQIELRQRHRLIVDGVIWAYGAM
jgi:hypothetical protein